MNGFSCRACSIQEGSFDAEQLLDLVQKLLSVVLNLVFSLLELILNILDSDPSEAFEIVEQVSEIVRNSIETILSSLEDPISDASGLGNAIGTLRGLLLPLLERVIASQDETPSSSLSMNDGPDVNSVASRILNTIGGSLSGAVGPVLSELPGDNSACMTT